MSTAHHERPASRASIETAKFLALHVWIVVGAIIIGTAVLNVFDVLAPVVEFLAVGSLVAFVASPIVNALEHKGISRSIGALAGLIVVVAVLVCLAMIVVPMIFSQLFELASRLPSHLREWGTWIDTITHDAQLFSEISWPGELGLVLAYWLACDYPRIHREIGTIVGEGQETTYRFMVAILARSVGGYMRGTIITSLIAGVLALLGFLLVGHPYAALMGVLTGILHLIPVVGPVISSAFATLVALFFSPMTALWTLIVSMVAQNLTDNVVGPKIMQSAVSVHPAMSLIAIVIGSALMGPLGMVIAIPLCAALKGLFIFYFENRTKRQLVSYDGAIFQGTPYRDELGDPVAAFDALGDDTFVNDSEIISDDVVPSAEAMPRPELDNPWSKLTSLQPGSTSVFRIPFSSDTWASRGSRDLDDDGTGDKGA